MTNKANAAYSHFKRKQAIRVHREKVAEKVKFMKTPMKSVGKMLSNGLVYLFWSILFNLTLVEFKINLGVGKLVVGIFNIVNKHKLRVHKNIQFYADKCKGSKK